MNLIIGNTYKHQITGETYDLVFVSNQIVELQEIESFNDTRVIDRTIFEQQYEIVSDWKALYQERNNELNKIINIIEETFPNGKGIRTQSNHVKAMYKIIKQLNINTIDPQLMEGMSSLIKYHN
ncbi:hypothetical protein [Macrococcoides bohemicum]|uniref:hypothetical protein n=1 Tax=Macrococcoides bohemicum TaxID=1903056 RepID=UPI00165D79E6|nr:hypothetical protein [Macrococcus bohemicus]MBC9875546.1 hypothetical protein [Macrococcus bohemicus]